MFHSRRAGKPLEDVAVMAQRVLLEKDPSKLRDQGPARALVVIAQAFLLLERVVKPGKGGQTGLALLLQESLQGYPYLILTGGRLFHCIGRAHENSKVKMRYDHETISSRQSSLCQYHHEHYQMLHSMQGVLLPHFA
jgi:hypothetical protein